MIDIDGNVTGFRFHLRRFTAPSRGAVVFVIVDNIEADATVAWLAVAEWSGLPFWLRLVESVVPFRRGHIESHMMRLGADILWSVLSSSHENSPGKNADADFEYSRIF